MEETPTAPSPRQIRPSRANKLLSQFKGIIRTRKTNDDRELGVYPYATQIDPMDTNAVMKPYMSQPHLALPRGPEDGQHDSELKLSKHSNSSERLAVRDDEGAQPTEPSLDRDFPLRTNPSSVRNSRKSDAPRSPPSPHPRSPRTQSPGTMGSMNTGNGRTIDGLPALMDPSKPLTAVPGVPTRAISPQTFQAQPAVKHPMTTGGAKRPSTAQSSQSTTGASPKASPLLRLKRSLSQLRLNSYSKQQPGAPSPSPPCSTPPITDSTSTRPVPTGSPPLPPLPTQLSEPSESPSILPSSNSHIPLVRSNISSTTTTTITTSNTQPHSITMATSGALAPMTTHPKPLPHPMNSQRRTPTQPPKLSLSPINHRISLTIPSEMGYAKFSPTIITRPTPLPISNLPTLAPKLDSLGATSAFTRSGAGQSRDPSRAGPPTSPGAVGKASKNTDKRDKKATRAQLKSMPALPLQGTGRGVGGREEVDDIEDDDEEEDDDTGDEEDETSRPDSSRSDLLWSDTSQDSSIQMDTSATSSGSSSRFDHFRQDSHSRSKGGGQRQEEGSRSTSSGSSYHSAVNEFSSYPTPELMGMRAVPLLKQPTPPHAAARNHAQVPASSRTQTQSLLPLSSSKAAGSISPTPNPAAKGPLPEVDTSSLDLPFFSRGPLAGVPSAITSAPYAAPVVDVKGKGKARDFSSPTVIGGGEFQDPARTPTGTSHGVLFRGGGGFMGGATTTTQSSVINPKSPVAQSPTGTLRQQQQHYHHHHHGGGGAVDYFSAKGGAPAVVSTSATATATSATSPHSGHHFVLPNSYSSRSSNRYSTSFTPTSQVTTPRPGMGGTRSSFIMSGMPTPKRSSTLMLSPDAGIGAGAGGGKYAMPAMYKRASQSLIDLHTIETKEKRRIMEEEARAEEDEELAQMREKEKEREREKKEKQGEGEKRMDEEKIKEDDGDEEAAERQDVLGAPTSPTTTNVQSMTTTASTKNQNRLSRASVYLRRRRSMPMFDESSEPPPYPSFAPFNKYKVMPREDEGREKLPPYTNPISLKAIMPRKMEFSAPGVQSRDRKWRRVLCVLEGTVFKVYKCPPGQAGVSVLGEWWEKQVGAGDVSLQPSHAGAVPTIQIETRESRRLAEERRDFERQVQRIMKAEGRDWDGLPDDEEDRELVIVPTPSMVPSVVVHDDTVGSRSRSPSTTTISSSRSRFANLLKPGKNHGRSKSDAHFNERNTPSPSPRPSLNIPRSGMSTPISARSPSPYSASMRPDTAMSGSSQGALLDSTSEFTGRATPGSSYSSMRSASRQQLQQQQITADGQSAQQHLYTNRERNLVPDARSEDLIQTYSMQQAESGLGNDYAKRKNVIRVRLEGEQFLLQARDVTGVVEWIEALQAATNIALDLDERPMPRGPLFPRRRRRRRPQIGGSVSNAGETGQTSLPSTGGRTVTTT